MSGFRQQGAHSKRWRERSDQWTSEEWLSSGVGEREKHDLSRDHTSHFSPYTYVRGRIGCCRTSSIVVWACFGGIFFTVYAVYAISSLDTGSPLRHRTQNMQRRRDTPGSCRARSPALHVGRRDRVASYGHVHRTRMLICMHIWGSSLHFVECRINTFFLL